MSTESLMLLIEGDTILMTKSILLILAWAGLMLGQQKTLTTNGGVPVGDNQNSKTAGESGPVLLEDIHLVEKLASFDRERIPERVVHARGVGAFGEFVSGGNFSELTKASFLNAAGKKTKVFVRFSTVIFPSGSPETVRDPRGFATKFYTDEGNYDIVGNNLPVFFIRDAMKFPDMVHSLKPSPVTNRQDPNRFFDFFSHVPESTHMLTLLYSDLGIPASFREMDGSGVHAFKWVNANGDYKYVKYTWKSQQGVHGLTTAEAARIQAEDFSHATKDLYAAIKAGKFPSWDLYVQALDPADLDKFSFNPLDATKVWPETVAPLRKVGTMTLNQTPDNFFDTTEQAAFSPGNLVPGIEPSEDRLLQGRLFSYFDTQRYRIGPNFQQLPVNRPLVSVDSYNQGGPLSNRGATSDVNYQPNDREDAPYVDTPAKKYSTRAISGTTMQHAIAKQDNFEQAGVAYLAMSAEERNRLIANLSGDLSQVTSKAIKVKMVSYFYTANTEFGTRLAKAVGVAVPDVQAIAKK
jgi:catalase